MGTPYSFLHFDKFEIDSQHNKTSLSFLSDLYMALRSSVEHSHLFLDPSKYPRLKSKLSGTWSPNLSISNNLIVAIDEFFL